jgi:hypothetical protein
VSRGVDRSSRECRQRPPRTARRSPRRAPAPPNNPLRAKT